jgi:benzoyl-CoA 2,3-dioxygenase component B
MKASGYAEDVRKLGGIDLPTIQKHINLWVSLSLDLHGGEVSTNAASYFANGLKGRAQEDRYDDHSVAESYYQLEVVEDGQVQAKAVAMRTAMNEVLRDWYVKDCQGGIDRWNRILDKHGILDRLRLPDRKFNRGIGQFRGLRFDPHGRPVSAEEWERREDEWLPSPADKAYLLSIQNEPVYESGKFANYIAPPRRGINNMPINFEYVRTEM